MASGYVVGENTKPITSGSSQSGTSMGNPYLNLSVRPLRDNNATILFSWNRDQYSDFNSLVEIRLYLTTVNPANISFNQNWNASDTNPFSDTMPNSTVLLNDDITQSATEGDLHMEYVSGITYDGCYPLILIKFTKLSDSGNTVYGSLLKSTNMIKCNVVASAPAVSYDSTTDTLTVGTSMAGRRIVEFYCSDHSKGYPTNISDDETLNEMYYASLINLEEYSSSNPFRAYYNLSGEKLTRWAPGNYTVGVNFKSNTNRSIISDAIDNALSEINSVLNSYGVYFTRGISTTGDISVIVDSEYNLYGINPATGSWVYGGTWETTETNGTITKATVKLANDYFEYAPFETYRTAALEELLQSMGAGYDQDIYPYNTMHCETNYLNKPDYITTKDANILRLVYSSYVSPGDGYLDVALKLNIPIGCFIPVSSTSNTERSFQLGAFLNGGSNYKVRTFIVNSNGEVSASSNWIDVSIPLHPRPSYFAWTYAKTTNGNFNLTAREWNSFCATVNGFRQYKEKPTVSFTTAYSGNDFTAAMYNAVRSAIQGIGDPNEYGTYIPSVVAGQTITADMLNIIVSEINAIT